MPLSTIQKNHMDLTVRPGQDTLIRVRHQLDTLVKALDAFAAVPANALPLTGPLDDGRDDAPPLTGEEIVALRNLAANMRDQVSQNALDLLIGKAVRPYSTIIGA